MDSQSQFIASAMAICHYKVNKNQFGKDTDDFGVQKKDKHLLSGEA